MHFDGNTDHLPADLFELRFSFQSFVFLRAFVVNLG
jgi:hypothetical protein